MHILFHFSLSSGPRIPLLCPCEDESYKLIFRHRWPRPWSGTGWSRSDFASRDDPHCLQVLQRHFPGREIRQDVAELAELPAEAELLAAGFPCEVRHIPINFVFLSYSFKGCEHNEPKPTRTQGNRTALCSHIFRLLRKTRVPWVLLENVPGLQMWHLAVDPPQKPVIAHIVHELESLGYSWALAPSAYPLLVYRSAAIAYLS